MKKRVLSVQFVMAGHQEEQDVGDPDRVDGCNLESRGGMLRSDNRPHQLFCHANASRIHGAACTSTPADASNGLHWIAPNAAFGFTCSPLSAKGAHDPHNFVM